MARAKSSSVYSAPSTATIGFEAKLWLAADKPRNDMDTAEYKPVVLSRVYDAACGSGGMFVQSEKSST